MLGLASLSSQEANAMIILSNVWLKWSREVNLHSSVLVMEVDEDGVTVMKQGQG